MSVAESSNILEKSTKSMGAYYPTCFKMELGKFTDGNVEYKWNNVH